MCDTFYDIAVTESSISIIKDARLIIVTVPGVSLQVSESSPELLSYLVSSQEKSWFIHQPNRSASIASAPGQSSILRAPPPTFHLSGDPNLRRTENRQGRRPEVRRNISFETLLKVKGCNFCMKKTQKRILNIV